MDDAVAALIEAVYAAALLPDGWTDWTARAGAWLGGIATGFTVWDRPAAAIRCQILQHPDERAIERYMDAEIWRIDPQMPLMHRIDRPTIFTDVDSLDRDDPATRDYLRYQAANSDMSHFLSIATPLSPAVVAGFSVHRRVADGATPIEARERLEAIAPHVRRALELSFAHARLLDAAYWDGLLAEREEPAALLDEHGRLLRTSPAAAALLSASDGLDAPRDRLAAADPASDATLQRMVAAAVRRERPAAGAARIARPSARAAFVVSAFPIVRRVRPLAPVEAAALVTLVDPAHAPTSRPALWRQAFLLTAREAALAAELVAGHSLESAAAVLEMSRNTARAHLRGLFAKTDCTRQAELIRLLTRI